MADMQSMSPAGVVTFRVPSREEPQDPAAVAPVPMWFQQVIQRDLLCDATGRRAKAAVAVPAAVADGPMPPYHVILEFMVRKLIANLPDSFPVEQKPDVPPFSWYCSDAEDPHFKIIEGIQTAVAASDRKSFGELHDGET